MMNRLRLVLRRLQSLAHELNQRVAILLILIELSNGWKIKFLLVVDLCARHQLGGQLVDGCATGNITEKLLADEQQYVATLKLLKQFNRDRYHLTHCPLRRRSGRSPALPYCAASAQASVSISPVVQESQSSQLMILTTS